MKLILCEKPSKVIKELLSKANEEFLIKEGKDMKEHYYIKPKEEIDLQKMIMIKKMKDLGYLQKKQRRFSLNLRSLLRAILPRR